MNGFEGMCIGYTTARLTNLSSRSVAAIRGESRAHETSSIRLNDREQTEDAVRPPLSPSQTLHLEEERTTLLNLSETIPREDDTDFALRTIDQIDYSITLSIRAVSVFPYS
jgi:hypothetical protein